jgi:hypothetical protein
MLVISVRGTRDLWQARRSFDHLRGFWANRYEVPRDALRTMADLTAYLREINGLSARPRV